MLLLRDLLCAIGEDSLLLGLVFLYGDGVGVGVHDCFRDLLLLRELSRCAGEDTLLLGLGDRSILLVGVGVGERDLLRMGEEALLLGLGERPRLAVWLCPPRC